MRLQRRKRVRQPQLACPSGRVQVRVRAERPGNKQHRPGTHPRLDIGPSLAGQPVGRRQHDQLRAAQRIGLVLAHRVGLHAVHVVEHPYRGLLRLERLALQHGKLERLRQHHRHLRGRQPGRIRRGSRRKPAQLAHHPLPHLGRAVRALHAEVRLARPVPLQRAGRARGKAQRPLALLERRARQLVIAPAAVGVPGRLVAGFARNVRHAGSLRRDGVPQQRPVLPVGVIGCKCHPGAGIELVQQSIRHPAFILAHVYRLRAAGCANRPHHAAHPVAERILRKQVIVQRPHLIGIAGAVVIQIGLLRQRDRAPAAQLFGPHLPGLAQRFKRAVVLFEPALPGFSFGRVAVRHIAMKHHARVGERGLIDQVPGKIRNATETLRNRADILLLRVDCPRIEIRIGQRTLPVRLPKNTRVAHARRKRKAGEVDRNVVTLRRRQVGLEVAQKALICLAGQRLHKLARCHPHPGPDKVDPMPLHIGKVMFPNGGVARA